MIRTLLGLAFLGLAAWSLLPLLMGIRSTQAAVNAPVLTLRSPIDGMLVIHDDAAAPSFSDEKASLLEITNPLADDGRLDSLRDECALLEARVGALREQEVVYQGMQDSLESAARKYGEARLRLLEKDREAAQSGASAAKVMEQQRRTEKETLERLDSYSQGANSPMQLLVARSTAEASRHTASQARKHVEGINEQIRALLDGIHVSPNDGRNDLPYSAQRFHELTIRLAEVRSSLRQDEARLARVRKRLHVEEERLALRSRFTMPRASRSVVWRRHSGDGTAIRAGSPLVDLVNPSEVFVDALVHEKYLTHLRPGDGARVRLFGSGEEFDAVVRQVAGRMLPWSGHTLATEPVRAERCEVHVVLCLCDAGRRWDGGEAIPLGWPAEVTFHPSGNLLQRFLAGLLR